MRIVTLLPALLLLGCESVPQEPAPQPAPQPECRLDADCDDGVFCNGDDRCVGGECATFARDTCASGTVCDEEAQGCITVRQSRLAPGLYTGFIDGRHVTHVRGQTNDLGSDDRQLIAKRIGDDGFIVRTDGSDLPIGEPTFGQIPNSYSFIHTIISMESIDNTVIVSTRLIHTAEIAVGVSATLSGLQAETYRYIDDMTIEYHLSSSMRGTADNGHYLTVSDVYSGFLTR